MDGDQQLYELMSRCFKAGLTNLHGMAKETQGLLFDVWWAQHGMKELVEYRKMVRNKATEEPTLSNIHNELNTVLARMETNRLMLQEIKRAMTQS